MLGWWCCCTCGQGQQCKWGVLDHCQGSLDPQSITAVFERKGRNKVTYSHCQHTKSEAQAEIIQWVSESKRPFNIKEQGFQSLMKTGRPHYYIPSTITISWFLRCQTCLCQCLKMNCQDAPGCNDRYNHVIHHHINTRPYGLDPILRNHVTFPAHIPEPVRSRPVPRSWFAVLRSCGALRQTRVPT